MKLNDEKTRSVAAAVSDVLEGKHKMKKEEVKYPHKMYSKDGKDEVEVKDKAEHDKYAAKGYVHEKPEVNEVEEPRAKGEKDFKAKHVIKKSGENNDGTVTKEGIITKGSIKSKASWKKAHAALQKMEKQFKGTKKEKDYYEVLNAFYHTIDDWDDMDDKDRAPYSKKTATDRTYGDDPIADLRFDLKKLLGPDSSKILEYMQVDEVLGFDKDNPHKDEDEKEKEKKEGNAFTKALNAARKNGDDDFVVSGKKYKVEDYDEEEDEDEVEETYSPAMVKKAVDMAKKSGGMMTPVSKKIEAMKKGLSDHPKVKAAFKAANEDVEVTDEMIEEANQMNEAEDKKTKYRKFFDKALKKFGVSSPAELKGDKKKEFFDYVDANYEAENETD